MSRTASVKDRVDVALSRLETMVDERLRVQGMQGLRVVDCAPTNSRSG